ncbi:MAG: cyclic nucleotide-binding domain-containing protein [Alcanivoracaceae bacterium]|nr:cyclic nucleotide-binding domain-containing protein [Alcanivoracaceae bacterium]
MISLAEPTAGFSALTRQYKRLVSELLSKIDLPEESLQLNPTENGFRDGMHPGKTYLVKGGMLTVRCQDRKIFTWDEGDLIFPDAAPDAPDTLKYSSENAVLLTGFDTLELVRAVLSNDDAARIWTRLLMTQQGLLVRLIAARADEETQTTPGFAYFMPGDVIISQGDSADYVFSLFEGNAEVLVDDIAVGEVNEGEVLGALAVLTHSPRSATVRAKSRCSVVKVPKDQFKNLIRTNPTMIHGLLTDMANQIKKLNAHVVELSG